MFVNAQFNCTMHICKNTVNWEIDSNYMGGLILKSQEFAYEFNYSHPINSVIILDGPCYGGYDFIKNPEAYPENNNVILTFKLTNLYFISCNGAWKDVTEIDTAYISYQVQTQTNSFIVNLTIIIDTTTCATATINEPVNMSSIEIYPNPFTDNVNLKINALESSKTNVTLIDMLGKVYENKEVEILVGENNINLPVNCPSGIYFLSFVLDNKTITYKIIK